MPIRMGSANVTLRLGSAPVSRAYLGALQALFPPTTTTTPTTGGKHAAPINAAATAGNASAVVTWDSAPGPTAWLVQYSTSGGSVWTEVPGGGVSYSAGPATTGVAVLKGTATLVGLTNGTPYVFRIASQKDGVWSDYSMQTSSVTPVATPAVPENLTVSVPSGSPFLLVSWDGGGAQASFVGSVSYELEKSSDSGATWTPAASEFIVESGRAQQIRLWGNRDMSLPPDPDPTGPPVLSLGSFLPATSYVFRLRRVVRPPSGLQPIPATPGIFTVTFPPPLRSGFSTATAAVTTPAVRPEPPRHVQVEPFAGGFAVSWLQPLFVGSSAITSYKVYAVPAGSSLSGATAAVTVAASDTTKIIFTAWPTNVPARRAVVTGLTNGTSYDIHVTAVNDTGESDSLAWASTRSRTPLASVPAGLESLIAEPVSAGCTRPSGQLYAEMRLVYTRSEMTAWETGSPAATVEVQYAPAGRVTECGGTRPEQAVGVCDEYFMQSTASGMIAPSESRFMTLTHASGWQQDTTTRRLVIEYSATGQKGPVLTTGVSYVFRVRPVKGTSIGPWTYATATSNC